ncbi:MAG TPA: tetratricopeptide repeat protein [Acetobacteraceae bacterium]|nr:tetratricopeptide repeat protein [Acetobacteraceae bacterium]
MGHTSNGAGARAWHAVREHATHWAVGGILLAATGFAPEEWFARAVDRLHISEDTLHLWHVGVDLRLVPIALGVVVIVGDVLRRQRAPAIPHGKAETDSAHVPLEVAALPLPDRPSIAVLPLANLSDDPEQEYFSDGITDDIITELSRDRALFVIARSSSFTYRGRSIDIKQVGRELGVRYVVEGSVRRESGRVRVTAQLIDATDGSHVWAERYDKALEHVFEVQDEITAAVVTAIRPALGNAEQRRALRKPPEHLSAWEAYQRGLWHMGKYTLPETARAREFFQQAALLDPGFAAPHVGIAQTYIRETYYFGVRQFTDGARLIRAEARQALEIDADESDAHHALGQSFAFAGNWPRALDCLERALALNRNSAAAHELKAAGLTYSGHPEEGRREALESLRINPRAPSSAMAASLVTASYYLAGDYAAAVQAARRSLADYPAYPQPRRFLAAGLGQLGRTEEARAALEDFMAAAPAVFDAFIRNRAPYVRREDHEHMLDGLRKAGWRG